MRQDLCVYLNEEEYAELEKSVGHINQWIETIVPAKKKSVLKGYVWKLKAHNPDEQNEVEECHEIFYKREHAVNMGIKTGYKYLAISTELQILEEWLPIPDELKFLQQLYLYMIYKTCCFIARQNCPGCDENVLMDDAKQNSHSWMSGCYYQRYC